MVKLKVRTFLRGNMGRKLKKKKVFVNTIITGTIKCIVSRNKVMCSVVIYF